VNRTRIRWAGMMTLLCTVAAMASGPAASAAGQNSPSVENLRSFPGRVLVAAPGSLPSSSGLVVEHASVGAGTYQVAYRTGSGRAMVQGDKGRDAFDTEVLQSADRACSAGAYCATGRRAAGGATSEVFRNLKVHGDPGILTHDVGGADAGWTLHWYDRASDVSYALTLSESVGGSLHAGGTDPTNVSTGSTVVALAESLTPQAPAAR